MNYSHNTRAHALYSGILGIFLETEYHNNSPNIQNPSDNPIHNQTLKRAAI